MRVGATMRVRHFTCVTTHTPLFAMSMVFRTSPKAMPWHGLQGLPVSLLSFTFAFYVFQPLPVRLFPLFVCAHRLSPPTTQATELLLQEGAREVYRDVHNAWHPIPTQDPRQAARAG